MMRFRKCRKVMAIILIFIISCSMCNPVNASNTIRDTVTTNKKITIYFNNDLQSSTFNTAQSISRTDITNNIENRTEVMDFFEVNELDYNYYMDWIKKQDISTLESVKFTVFEPEITDDITLQSSSAIKGSRIVYADASFSFTEKTKKFPTGELMYNVVTEAITYVISKYYENFGTIATVVGIINPKSYFGQATVRVNKEYYTHSGGHRLVSKFVELKAPVNGTTKWYAWGYAEGDYVNHKITLYYKANDIASGKKYVRYTTPNYYKETTLINKVKAAYPSTYTEAATPEGASAGGYSLTRKIINKTGYYEYDEECN